MKHVVLNGLMLSFVITGKLYKFSNPHGNNHTYFWKLFSEIKSDDACYFLAQWMAHNK